MRKNLSRKAAAFLLASMILCLPAQAAREEEEYRDTIGEKFRTYQFRKTINGEKAEEKDWEFSFDCMPGATFTITTIGQPDIVLGANCDADPYFLRQDLDANLTFFSGSGQKFLRTGTLYIPADEGDFLYLNYHGILADIGVRYDPDVCGFEFRTQSIDQYVISDRPLFSIPIEQLRN